MISLLDFALNNLKLWSSKIIMRLQINISKKRKLVDSKSNKEFGIIH